MRHPFKYLLEAEGKENKDDVTPSYTDEQLQAIQNVRDLANIRNDRIINTIQTRKINDAIRPGPRQDITPDSIDTREGGDKSEGGSSFWGTLGKGLGATAIAGATVTAGAHALNWNLARRRTNSLKRRYQYEIFGCNEIEDPKRREACLKYNEDKANEELNQFIRLCDGTENPQACKDEILDMMEELL